MCNVCQDTGKIIYGSDTEIGRREMPCGCKEEQKPYFVYPVMTWDELKLHGSAHYQTGGIEPIDLYRSAGLFRTWAIVEIIQHAFRNRNVEIPLNVKDFEKIIDYAQKLIAACREDNP
jgi:hypothetical protein